MGMGWAALAGGAGDLEIGASAFAKAVSASGADLLKSAISKTVAAAPGLSCALLLPPFSSGNAAAQDEASIMARRRLSIGIRESPLPRCVLRRPQFSPCRRSALMLRLSFQ